MNGAKGVWGWLLQRVTAVGLILALGLHLWILHFAGDHAALTAAGVTIRMKSLAYMVLDFSLLGFALYHGLYGVRSVLFDYVSGPRAERAITAAVVVVGLVAFGYGVYALVPFITG
jgi:succinate dehydrogenase / fumarate reductase membrane anchor subunit